MQSQVVSNFLLLDKLEIGYSLSKTWFNFHVSWTVIKSSSKGLGNWQLIATEWFENTNVDFQTPSGMKGNPKAIDQNSIISFTFKKVHSDFLIKFWCDFCMFLPCSLLLFHNYFWRHQAQWRNQRAQPYQSFTNHRNIKDTASKFSRIQWQWENFGDNEQWKHFVLWRTK